MPTASAPAAVASSSGGRSAVLAQVTAALDLLVQAGARHGGLFPSILDRSSGEMPFTCPPPITGQRECDRSFPGSNLSHDHVVLRLLLDLDPHVPGKGYAAAARRYLDRFATHCTTLPTGFFPWGEHLFWNLAEDRVGSGYALARVNTMATHDHLLQAPVWLWEELWARNPAAVERFGSALDRHFLDVDGVPEFNRHANAFDSRPKRNRGARSCDFPRHTGFYALDWAWLLTRTTSAETERRLRRALDYWWDRRQPGRPLRLETRSGPNASQAVGSQTLSLGVSLLETAAVLAATHGELSALAHDRGQTYVRMFLDLPHDLADGRFINQVSAASGEPTGDFVAWGSSYGDGVQVATYGLLALAADRLAPNADLPRFAGAVAEHLAATLAQAPTELPVRDAGQYLALLTELHARTGEARWLALWDSAATRFCAEFFDGGPLPRIASGVEHYESQQLPGHLLRALARGALLSTGQDIGGDVTLR
jgi:hypothetical protein